MSEDVLERGLNAAVAVARGGYGVAERRNGHAMPAAAVRSRVDDDRARRIGWFKSVAASLAAKTRDYLSGETGIGVTEVHAATEHVEHLKLRDITAVIGVGGNVGVLVAFSFPIGMADVLYRQMTSGIEVRPDQVDDFREATISELANVIVGHCTADFAADGTTVAISPPVLVYDAKRIHRMNNAMFGTIQVLTPQGEFDIHMIGPRGLFDGEMNYRGDL